jgi:nucleoid DNA-binding protein
MEDLIKKLTETAGITEEQAAKAVATVVDFIKEKLPPMMHGVVDNFINSGTDATDDGIL